MLNQIYKIVEEIREKYPCEAELDGKIYYMNGNDGTDFDWEVNNRLCEFMVFHENEYGYIKINVFANGDIEVYIYPDGGMNPSEKLYGKYFGNVENFKDFMVRKFDGNGLWDESIDEFLDW